jgi:dTDP-4-dehydrorhamnose reductase
VNQTESNDRLRLAPIECHESIHVSDTKRKRETGRILIIGASGQVGASLYGLAEENEVCVGTYCNHQQTGLAALDLRDGLAVREIILDLRPDVCYLPGALTFVDYAESHPDECRRTNVEGVSHVAKALAEIGGLLVFFSTEHVFPESHRPWKEDDPMAPESVYAQSKAEAEQLVRDILPDRHLILRTSWVFGPDPQEKNFVFRVRRSLEKGKPLIVPSDQHGQPTFAPDLARTARQLVSLGTRGTYHVVGPQYLPRFSWACLIAKTLRLPIDLIQGMPTPTNKSSEWATPQPAPRPLHIRLDRSKLLSLLAYDPLRPPEDGVSEMMSEWARPCQ